MKKVNYGLIIHCTYVIKVVVDISIYICEFIHVVCMYICMFGYSEVFIL